MNANVPEREERWTMATATKFGLKGKGRDSYLELVSAFALSSIRSEEHFAAAQCVIDRLLAKGKHDPGEQMYLDALADLAAIYEDEHYPIERASDADLLRHFLDARELTAAQLSQQTNVSKSTISEVLAGKRRYSRSMMRKLADFFSVDVGIFAANV
jgi:HTH-type transcriptional regulator/antitoxin HigA